VDLLLHDAEELRTSLQAMHTTGNWQKWYARPMAARRAAIEELQALIRAAMAVRKTAFSKARRHLPASVASGFDPRGASVTAVSGRINELAH
jgi:hypothetical protein